MTTALETIPADEEGATLLPKPKTRVYDQANNGNMCLTDHKGKLTMEKCKGKEGDKTQQWQIGPM